MPTTTSSGLDDAMNKIAAILGTPTSSAAPTTPTTTTTTTTPSTTSTSTGGAAAPLNPAQRQDVANQIYYSLLVPPITPQILLEMEEKLPELVALLHSLAGRPAAQAQINSMIDASQTTTRSVIDPQMLNDLAQVIAQDAYGSKDAKFLPLVAAGLAFFMAGYTVVHQWKT
jgi:hypothetical protein